jgi:hypothetical protein
MEQHELIDEMVNAHNDGLQRAREEVFSLREDERGE